MDTRPNTVGDITFYITWSMVSLTTGNITADEIQSTIEVPVVRSGSLNTVSVQQTEGSLDIRVMSITFVHKQLSFEPKNIHL